MITATYCIPVFDLGETNKHLSTQRKFVALPHRLVALTLKGFPCFVIYLFCNLSLLVDKTFVADFLETNERLNGQVKQYQRDRVLVQCVHTHHEKIA